MLNLIPRPIHAALDYTYAAKALLAPRVMGFQNDEKANMVAMMMGLGAVASALVTRHEGGLIKKVPFNTHLKMDAASAVLSAASPWLLGFADNKRARNTILGLALLEAVVVLLSQPDLE